MLIRKIRAVTRTYRHLNRYRKVLSVLVKYGFGDWVDNFPLAQVFERGCRIVFRGQKGERLTRSERIRMAIEELGPTFIKLAQVLSTRPDLIPPGFALELEKLQDQVPPFSFEEVREIMECELESRLEDRFLHFDETPLAAASIGQVHRATLRSGEKVVVKVQRPGIRKLIEVDLEILYHLASLAERYIEEAGFQRPTRIVEEMARTLEKEMDYGVEATQAERFGQQFQQHRFIHVPRVYREFSTPLVLTLEYIPGIKITDFPVLDGKGFDRKVIASRGADLILEQIFTHGFFHADPHPGNVFILPGNVICYLDYGMMGSVDRRTREDFADLLHAVVKRDESKVVQVLLKSLEWDLEPDRRALEKDVANFLSVYIPQSMKDTRIAVILKQLVDMITRHRLRLPPDTFLMIKAMAAMEGIGLVLDPDFDLVKKAAPFIEMVKMKRFLPGRVMEDLLDSGADLVQLLKEIPGETTDIIRQIKQGKVNIGFEHRGLENFILQIDRASNRLSFSLIIAALIVGSSLIIQTQVKPFLFGFPVLGILGFTVAGLLGLGLLISILRSGRI